MIVANVSQTNNYDLPQALKTAQEAMQLPEVQEILEKLSQYKLGIFMPHMHDEQTGQFQPLDDNLMQVESGLQVSFLAVGEIASKTHQFLPVGWVWRAGALTTSAACEMVWEEKIDNTGRSGKHKMLKEN